MRKAFIIGLLVIALVISGCYGTKTATQPTTSPSAATGEVKEFTIEGSEFSFNPSSITVNAGDRVKITFKNTGSARHNLVIGDLGVSTSLIPAGSTDTVEFTADRSGTFAFYCSVPGHRSSGMEGQISIS